MTASDNPCLSLAIARLTAAEPQHYAIWVFQAPYPGGYVHHDRMWTQPLSELWQHWQSIFSLRGLPMVPHVGMAPPPLLLDLNPPDTTGSPQLNQPTSYTGRLMQNLGVSLWQWLFDGSIQSSFNQSQGIAMGQMRPLRLRLEIRDPDLIPLPWEIMQPQAGKQAASLSQQILFSRTTSDVDPLPVLRSEQFLRILLVLGVDAAPEGADSANRAQLDLEQEAASLAKVLETAATTDLRNNRMTTPALCQVKTLVQPSPAELIDCLESGNYNVLFYAGHGTPAPDGGMLLLHPEASISGTELAQVLVRCQVRLAVFNACWGAQPDQQGQQTIPRSSLAEVLIHHGVPAVLGMRDSVADQEALTFIQVFARALAERSPIDEAVAIARQQLLTLYKFNQPAWTLPVLYMHPEFNGELIRPFTEGVTEIPDASPSWLGRQTPMAYLRSVASPNQLWSVRGGIMRVGRGEGNDVVLQQPEVSREHAEIFYRDSSWKEDVEPTYLLRDRSRWGTWVLGTEGWHKVHHQEVPLPSKTQLKFGNPRSQALEFIIES
ncbi:MAG: CHAT domain-containing protein [Oscillatoriophycideae cyanobacterium NC_groundwater_1537_Pr4_S-0.65um_50_18]|nr:CHAT domain-containing protein [Oscillatoriophycideae cyanobacterium NC_groundwater_1537_Pr4_S-0.65um_50_18]